MNSVMAYLLQFKRLSGKDIKQDWQYQFLDQNCPDMLSLSNKVNNFFYQFDRSLNTPGASSSGPSGSSPLIPGI